MKLFNLTLFLALCLSSCTSNDDSELPLGNYEDGILIVNEGNAQSGSVTFAANNLQTVQQDIFSLVNPQQLLGGYVQSMFFNGDRAFIISNFANKITVVNRYTFEYLGSIETGLYHPRYGVVYNGKAYVTNMAGWESDQDDYVAVINLATFMAETPIQLDSYAERITINNGKIIVSNGAFGSGSSITIIDTAENSVQNINIGISPNSMAIVSDILYVLGNYTDGTSALVKIPLATPTSFQLADLSATILFAANLVEDQGMLYFTAGSKVYKMSATTLLPDMPLFDTQSNSIYIGYGFAVRDSRIYVCEATEDFISDGKVLVYNMNGSLLAEIPAGLGPNSIYFND